MASIDWKKAKLFYLQNDVTLSEVAAKFNVGDATVWRRASKENWKEEKKTFDRKVIEKVQEKSIEKKAKTFTEFVPVLQEGIIDTTTMLLAKIVETMSYGDAFSPRDLKSLSGMVNDLGFLLKDLKEDMNAGGAESDKVTVEFVKPYWETE